MVDIIAKVQELRLGGGAVPPTANGTAASATPAAAELAAGAEQAYVSEGGYEEDDDSGGMDADVGGYYGQEDSVGAPGHDLKAAVAEGGDEEDVFDDPQFDPAPHGGGALLGGFGEDGSAGGSPTAAFDNAAAPPAFPQQQPFEEAAPASGLTPEEEALLEVSAASVVGKLYHRGGALLFPMPTDALGCPRLSAARSSLPDCGPALHSDRCKAS